MPRPDEIGRLLAEARSAWSFDDARDLARRAGVDVDVVGRAEQGDATLSDLAAIVRALGGTMDDLLAGRRFWVAPVVAFKNAPEEVELALVRTALLRVTAAARDREALIDLLELPQRSLAAKLAPAPLLNDVTKQAEKLAGRVREALENVNEPITSVRESMGRLGIGTFLTRFGTEEVDGLSWRDAAGRAHAAANVDARGGAFTAIRMTLAHELCHVLFDGTRGHPFGVVERRTERSEGREQRANAFAAYFLAPRAAVQRFLQERSLRTGESPTGQHLFALSEHFGMGVEATAWHLVNCGLWRDDDVLRNRNLRTRAQAGEDDAELRPTEAEEQVPLERRGAVLEVATMALEKGLISVGRWREILHIGAADDWPRLVAERRVNRDLEHRQGSS